MKKSTTNPVCPYCGHVEEDWTKRLAPSLWRTALRCRQCPKCEEWYILKMFLHFESTTKNWQEAKNEKINHC